MIQRRNRTSWVLEPCSRLTISQQIGGMLYDFIDRRTITFSDGTAKQLLSCIREDTRMSDRTLRRIFLGDSDSLNHYLRVLIAIHEWTSLDDYLSLWKQVGLLLSSFAQLHGDQFLEEQAILHRPKHKAS